MASVTFEQATRCYSGADRPAVDHLDLGIADGEFVVLVGPSGCGKTTSLRMIAGLETVDSGRIRIGARDVTDDDPKDRDVAMVFQNYALYPHMTVAQNMGFALKIAKMSKAEIRERILDAARLLDSGALPGPQTEGSVRRAAPTGGHGPGDRPAAAGVPDGRTAVQPRRQAAGADAQPDRRTATAIGHHHRVRHPRSSRGDDHGRSGRGPARRCPATVRAASRAVPKSRQRVRCGIHRIAGDEPLHAPGRRQQCRHWAIGRSRCRARSPDSASELVVGIRPEHLEIGSRCRDADRRRRGTWRGRLSVRANRLPDNAFSQTIVARADGQDPPRGGVELRLRTSAASTCISSVSMGARLV